jgi:hypothetical protein
LTSAITAGVSSILSRPPRRMLVISTESRAFSAEMTLPMKGLSVQRTCE